MANADLNRDGIVDTIEAETYSKLSEAELKTDRDKTQSRLAWLAMLSIIVVTFIILFPLVDLERLEIAKDIIETFYIVQESIIGFYYGAITYMDSKK